MAARVRQSATRAFQVVVNGHKTSVTFGATSKSEAADGGGAVAFKGKPEIETHKKKDSRTSYHGIQDVPVPSGWHGPKSSKGPTVLDAIRAAGAHVPTLCFHPKFNARAVCRQCLVQVNTLGKPVPACYTPLEDGMEITTDSAELEAFRRLDLEMLISRHPNACMTCEVSGECKLQARAQEEGLVERWPKVQRGSIEHQEHVLADHSSPAIERDLTKCIECGLCADACSRQKMDVIGLVERGKAMLPATVFDVPLSTTDCISCGQCTLVCPVGALTERADWQRVLKVLDAKRRTTVVQTAPATRVAIGELFGLPPGSVSTGRLVAALRALGFDYVFDTLFTADLTIMEEANELVERVKARGPLPMFTSCCPGWVNYVELKRPDLLPHLSTTKSPQQMHGAITKEVFAPTLGGAFEAGSDTPFVVSIMPCTAKKDEAVRPGMRGHVDAVLTTRELARMLRHRGVSFASLPNDAEYDSPLGESSGAGMIFGASGGVMEAALRTATVNLLGQKDSPLEWSALRGVRAGVKVARVPGLGKVAAINSMGAAVDFLSDETWREFKFIEVMACLGGCLGGGGEPKNFSDPQILEKRARAVYDIDKGKPRRRSFENEQVQQLYSNVLGEPLSAVAKELLHTHYAPRRSGREILGRFIEAVDHRQGEVASLLFEQGGVWRTNGPLGDLQGRKEIQQAIDAKLPPRPDPTLQEGRLTTSRHRFASRSSGTVVIQPDGTKSEFDVQLSPTGMIRTLTRRVLV